MVTTFLFCIFFIVSDVRGRVGYGPGEQEWGHVEVRPGAHIFYWMFYAQHEKLSHEDMPTVLWVQGGPGVDSTGFGNFGQVGPIHVDGTPRQHSWVKMANLIFIDSPVGTGYSYVDDLSLLTTNKEEIAEDLTALLKELLSKYPFLKKTPLYFFGESSGGNMVAVTARRLNNLIKVGEIQANFKGIGMISSMISLDTLLQNTPANMLQNGLVDDIGYGQLMEIGRKVVENVAANKLPEGVETLFKFRRHMKDLTGGCSFYSSVWKIPAELHGTDHDVTHQTAYKHHAKDDQDDRTASNELMATGVRKALGIDDSIIFGKQNNHTFNAAIGEILVEATSVVEDLLENSDIIVAEIDGQHDVLFSTAGSVGWLAKIKWKGAEEWPKAERQPIFVNGFVNGYTKSVGKLHHFLVLRAGHMMPKDNPDAAFEILTRIFNM